MVSPELFIMQADKICREVFSTFSDSVFSRIEIRSLKAEGEADTNLLFIVQKDTLVSELEKSGEKYSISQVFDSEGENRVFVIFYNKEEKKLYEKYEPFFLKLVEQLFEYFIKEYKNDNSYFYNGSINSIIIQDSIDSLVTDISRKCCKNDDFSIYDNSNLSLKNILNELSVLTYEKSIAEGLIYFTSSPDNADFQFEFNNYEEYGKFDLNNLRLLRKLLELTNTKTQTGIISDTNCIYGIGSIKEGRDYFSVTFDDDRKWTVTDGENELISIRNNSLVFTSSLLSRKAFVTYATKIFGQNESDDGDRDKLSEIYSIIRSLVKQKKGTILVVKKDAGEFIQKYQDLCIVINPVKLDEKNVEKLSSIDGAIIMDDKCICYGFGAVLDGLDTGTGNRARGSRYNSSERFYNLYKNEEGTDLIVFILSDDGNYNFFPPLSD